MSKTIAPPRSARDDVGDDAALRELRRLEPPPPRTEREREGLQRGGLDPDAGRAISSRRCGKVHAVHRCMQYRPRGGS